ncbi:MAG: hypothetical protein K1X64_00290 [Myxococcaceae bacterium]|nr:hypothetical protein [Myxococcaceae bacterium]
MNHRTGRVKASLSTGVQDDGQLTPQEMATLIEESIAAFGALITKAEISDLGNRLIDEFQAFGDAIGPIWVDHIFNADLKQRVLDAASENSLGQFRIGREQMIQIVSGLVAKHHARLNAEERNRLTAIPSELIEKHIVLSK